MGIIGLFPHLEPDDVFALLPSVDADEARRAGLIILVIGVAVGFAVLVTLRSVWLAAGGA